MGRTPIRAKLVLDAGARSKLEAIAKSRTEGQARVERAKVLLAYHAGERVTALAEAFQTNRPKIERILNRALEMGALASLEDRPGRGRKAEITALVEVFFAKMTKTILRGIRVASKAELKARIMAYLQDLNADPVVFRWRYKLEEESVS
jgi:hypothetical protein